MLERLCKGTEVQVVIVRGHTPTKRSGTQCHVIRLLVIFLLQQATLLFWDYGIREEVRQ